MQIDIGEIRKRVLALTTEVKSRDVRYRLFEMHERLGTAPPATFGESRRGDATAGPPARDHADNA